MCMKPTSWNWSTDFVAEGLRDEKNQRTVLIRSPTILKFPTLTCGCKVKCIFLNFFFRRTKVTLKRIRKEEKKKSPWNWNDRLRLPSSDAMAFFQADNETTGRKRASNLKV